MCRFLTFSAFAVLICGSVHAQTAPAPTPAQAAPATAAASTAPDYPDPRTFTVGLVYWLSGNTAGDQPNIITGKAATDFEDLKNIGKPKNSPGVDLSMPVTRTGEVHLEGFVLKGTGNQVTKVATDPYFSGTYNAGDYISSQYQIRDLHVYLDDLLYPHKFPVSRLRFKSLLGFEWLQVKSTLDSPLAANPTTDANSSSIFYPTFGVAAEYALSKHVLARVSTDGFAFPHRAVLGKAQGEIAVRIKSVEIVGGGKYLHFKTSPKKESYVVGTMIGAFVEARYHF